MALKVAVTGPTGEIGRPLLFELERRPEVGSVLGMARRPFDPAEEGWEKVSYRRGDILDRGALAALFDGRTCWTSSWPAATSRPTCSDPASSPGRGRRC
jgi:nucleoside-diphosphate-sugar epimerase